MLKSIDSCRSIDQPDREKAVCAEQMRWGFATNLARRGMDVQEVQRLLGHSSLNTTMRYVCVDDSNVQASYNKYIA